VQTLYDRTRTLGVTGDAMLGAGAALIAAGSIMWLTGLGELADHDSTISYLPLSGGGEFVITGFW
jgi:hypothetical protein